MNRRLRAGLFLLVAAVAGFAGYYIKHASLSSPASEAAARKLMLSSLTDPNGKVQAFSQWQGKILVVNYWATWCTPCREEVPALKKIQSKYAPNSVEVVGIALDNAVKVREYAAEMAMDYTLLVAGAESLTLSKELGNQAGVLPYTVVLDRNGKVAYTHAGATTEATLDAVLAPLL